jgi:hypothetical protein
MQVLSRCALSVLFVASVASFHASAANAGKEEDRSSPEMGMCASGSATERTRPNVTEAKSVYFVNLRDGDKVTSPFRIAFGLVGMGIAPAGVRVENTGHHHLLIDHKLTNEMLIKPIPFSEKYRHYAKGETEATLELPPGKHTLRLLFADADHKPYYISSKEITIEVIARNGFSKKQ